MRFSWQEPYNFLAAEAGAAKNSTWSRFTKKLEPNFAKVSSAACGGLASERVGSNFFLSNRKLSAEYKKSFAALRAGGGARSASNTTDSFSLLVGALGIEPSASRSRTPVLTLLAPEAYSFESQER